MHWVVEALWLAAAAIAYMTLAPNIAIYGMAPVLPVIIVVRVAITHGELPGNLVGFASGLLLDLFSLEWFGVSMLVGSVVGYVVGIGRSHLMIGNVTTRAIVLLASAEVYTLGVVLVKSTRGAPGPEPFLIALGSGLYTAVVGYAWWFLSGITRRWFGWRGTWDAER
jgi:rod shape-determining protein MreD